MSEPTDPPDVVEPPDDEAAAQAEALFVFDSTGAAQPAELALSREDQRALVTVGPTGEVRFHAG